LGRELENTTREVRSLNSVNRTYDQAIPFNDKRLFLESSSPIQDSGGVFDRYRVKLKKIQADVGRSPRLLRIYKQISDIALVQRLHGVIEDDSAMKFAILEDLSEHDNIAKFIRKSLGERIPPMQKLRFAYELAATLSSLHESRILVKTISDHSIYVKNPDPQSWTSVISELDQAREVT
jgi:serine/threonine protein kinase